MSRDTDRDSVLRPQYRNRKKQRYKHKDEEIVNEREGDRQTNKDGGRRK